MCVPLPEVCPPPPLLPFGLGQALGPRAAVQPNQQLWEEGHTMRRSPESCLYVGLGKRKEASCSCLCRVSAPCIGPRQGLCLSIRWCLDPAGSCCPGLDFSSGYTCPSVFSPPRASSKPTVCCCLLWVLPRKKESNIDKPLLCTRPFVAT